jgi:fumarylacetoacetase
MLPEPLADESLSFPKVGRVAGFGDIPPSFLNQPLAYNGRASSVVASGTYIQRPYGITSDGLYPSKKLDYEVELGMFVSTEISFGELVPASHARDYIFGFVLLNDWSARDVQFAEMVPLGPFNGKSCGTSISTWVVTMDALEEAGAIIPVKADAGTRGKATSNPFLKCAEDISIEISTFIASTLW